MRLILFLIGLLVFVSGVSIAWHPEPAPTPTSPINGPTSDLREVGDISSPSLADIITAWFVWTGLFVMAFTLLRWPAADRFLERPVSRVFPDLPLRNVFPWHRHRPLPLISQSVHFGLFFGSLLWILIFVLMVLRTPQPLYGLSISFPTRHSSAARESPWPRTLALYVDSNGNFSLNSKPIPRPNLRASLQQELAHRAVWTVYFEAANNSSYSDAVYAMDTIQGLGAQVIWLTPKLRQRLATQEAAL
jgi:biopolymer transport protein ExbD